jgi:hypothetical protein
MLSSSCAVIAAEYEIRREAIGIALDLLVEALVIWRNCRKARTT